MNHVAKIITRLILTLLVIFISFAPGNSAEIDDSTVFVEAFNAYQQKDYLLAIEKCDQLNQVFPDSPLRDVTLLLMARASLKSGNNERAAKSVALFSTEFPESSLKTSVEDELKMLVSRHQKGEVLAADKTLQSAACKVSSDRLARERAAELRKDIFTARASVVQAK
jgi:TolA-binding protein